MENRSDDIKNKLYVGKSIFGNPTFLLTQNVLFDVRGTINYKVLNDETVFWTEEVFIPFLVLFNKVCEPVISFCQKYRENSFSKIESAIRDKKNYNDLESKSESIREKVELLQHEFDEKRKEEQTQNKQMVVIKSLKAFLKKEEDVEKLTALETKLEFQENALKATIKELKILESKRHKYLDEIAKIESSTLVLSKRIRSDSKLLEKYFALVEEAETYIKSNFFKEEVIAKFSIGLWKKLNSVYFNVRQLFSEEDLQKQLDEYIHEEDNSRKKDEEIKREKSTKSRKERKTKEPEKKLSKFIPNLDRFLKNAFVRDVTKDSVNFEVQIMQLQKQIDGIDRRKKELKEQFVNDAIRRSKDSDPEVRELGEMHKKLYEKILVSFDSEKRVVELLEQELQEKLVKTLIGGEKG